ncbi:MAG: DUF4167 domain-containing protein [Dongiaceae bacterium]
MRQGPNHRRSRGRGQRRQHNNNMPTRQQTFDSSGPDIRIRGNAYQVLEKYLAMARDATSAGDRVAAENFFQHAEHYFRLINANGGDHGGPNGRNRQAMRPDGQDAPPLDGQGESSDGAVTEERRGAATVNGASDGDDGEEPAEGQA